MPYFTLRIYISHGRLGQTDLVFVQLELSPAFTAACAGGGQAGHDAFVNDRLRIPPAPHIAAVVEATLNGRLFNQSPSSYLAVAGKETLLYASVRP